MGTVTLAVNKYDKKKYVLKERKISELGKRKDIMHEVSLLSQLQHQNVIRCDGWFAHDNQKSIYIVLEWCSGGDLHTLIQRRKKKACYFDERSVWIIFQQICNGLKHLHEHGIVHRDLKPLNIMYSKYSRSFKVADLGKLIVGMSHSVRNIWECN